MGKIFIGEVDKQKIISEYIAKHDIKKVYTMGDDCGFGDTTKFSDVIEYEPFYRLLQQIDSNSLVILNECLRKKNRYDLAYNCIRHYLQQTNHRLVFNFYPIIEQEDDFAILMDFILPNPFVKQPYKYMTDFSNIYCGKLEFDIKATKIEIDESYIPLYEQEKEKIILEVKRDPNIIPRRLLTFSEKINKKYVNEFDSMKNKKCKMNVVVNQLGVDKWYYKNLMRWKGDIENVIYKIHEAERNGSSTKTD